MYRLLREDSETAGWPTGDQNAQCKSAAVSAPW